MKSRYKAILTTTLVALCFVPLLCFYGYKETWQLWNIGVMSPHFADLRMLTNGADAHAQGLDPMVSNPTDPWKRRLNYPRVWQGLYSLGLNDSHTNYLGIAFIVSFLIGVCLILPNATNNMILAVFAAVLSPATLLGIERANTDLLTFFLVSLSVIAIQRSAWVSTVMILDGFVLKLYPIFGFPVLFRAERSKFLSQLGIIVVFGACYALATYSDLLLINQSTPKATILGYGMNVVWMKLGGINPNVGHYAKMISYALVILMLVAAFMVSLQKGPLREQKGGAIHLDSFRAGAAIYIGTFLLGNNFDYRLIFLILTLPQLVLWLKVSTTARLTLVATFISLWYTVLARLFSYLSYGGYVSFGLDELCNWFVFAGMLFLFFGSLPAWVREQARKIFPFTARATRSRT